MVAYNVWGNEGIDDNSRTQMQAACDLPVAVSGALMPDAHLGYGLPIGGVLALDNAVCPYAVGVDIACRMAITLYNIPKECLEVDRAVFKDILKRSTFFGLGAANDQEYDHPVMHEDWSIMPFSEHLVNQARKQLGTSGGGNHFAEFGECDGMVALMTHSGSRRTGMDVCNYFSAIAADERPEYGKLAWLDLDSRHGQEYWAALELMGRYAAANHELIHDRVTKLLGVRRLDHVENHHNFAWKEKHGGQEVVVHRKGATPAHAGTMGVIPGSMGTAAYIVRGKGNPSSLCSASHGAGRLMSRGEGHRTFDWDAERLRLFDQGITVMGGAADEVPGVYKDIDQVMAAQSDLVEIVAKFSPKIVMMAGGRGED
jgi:tRNA-splicing ligase RtcB